MKQKEQKCIKFPQNCDKNEDMIKLHIFQMLISQNCDKNEDVSFQLDRPLTKNQRSPEEANT